MKHYFVYVGHSLIEGEEGCITGGLSSNGLRREYNKVMKITFVLPCKSLRHARAVEREGHNFLDSICERAIVKWSPLELENSPNRGWDWWIHKAQIMPDQYLDLFERMRHRQLNWNESVTTSKKRIKK